MFLVLGISPVIYAAVVNYDISTHGDVLVYSIDGLMIDGQAYNVEFKEDDYSTLWPVDPPLFYGDRSKALAAGEGISNAIRQQIGIIFPYDIYIIDDADRPKDYASLSYDIPYLVTTEDPVRALHYLSNLYGPPYWPPVDGQYILYNDGRWTDYNTYPLNYDVMYAKFTSVPIPSAAWLVCSGLIGIVGLKKKFLKCGQRHGGTGGT